MANFVLYDDFNDNSFDTSKWTGLNEGDGDFSVEVNGQMKFSGTGNVAPESFSEIFINEVSDIVGIGGDFILSGNPIPDACITLIIFFDSDGSDDDHVATIDLCSFVFPFTIRLNSVDCQAE